MKKGSRLRLVLKNNKTMHYLWVLLNDIFYSLYDLVSIYNAEIVLLNMGKTGSNTLEKSIIGNNVIKLYIPTRTRLYRRRLLWTLDNKSFNIGLYGRIVKFLLHGKKRKYISVIREPLARNLSGVFQKLDKLVTLKSVDLNTTSTDFIHNLFTRFKNHDYFELWLENILEYITDIDLLNHEFNAQVGYGIYNTEKVDLLILTIEKLAANTDVISTFLNSIELSLLHENNSANKWYSSLYMDVMKKITFEENILDYYYNNHYVQKFYTEKMITAFRDKWGIKREL